MTELNGNEKYRYGVPLPTAAQYFGKIEAGDLMLYGSNCLVLFYGAAGGYSYTRIGKLTTTDGLAKAVGNGAATVIALFVFKEAVSKRLWIAIALITLASVLLSFVLLKEGLSWMFLAALGVMVAGAAFVVVDTLVRHHTHPHQHTFTHFHGGYVHTHTITHTHWHDHLMTAGEHFHKHSFSELERELVN